MPSIILTKEQKKRFEGIRGKFLSTNLFTDISRAESLMLMVDILNTINEEIDLFDIDIDLFEPSFIQMILEKRKEKK